MILRADNYFTHVSEVQEIMCDRFVIGFKSDWLGKRHQCFKLMIGVKKTKNCNSRL